jgi:hypothetical protein
MEERSREWRTGFQSMVEAKHKNRLRASVRQGIPAFLYTILTEEFLEKTSLLEASVYVQYFRPQF